MMYKLLFLKRALLLMALFSGYCQFASAQTLEGNTWIGLQFEKEIVNDIKLEIGQEFRFSDYVVSFNSSVSEVGVTYKPIKYLSVGGSYRYTFQDFRSEHRGSIQVTPRYKTKDWAFSFRLKYQLEKSMFDPYSHGLRQKIQVKYDDFKDWRPYFYAESFYFARNDFKGFNRIRIGYGNEIDIVKGHDIAVALFYQREFIQETPSHSLTLSLSYLFNP